MERKVNTPSAPPSAAARLPTAFERRVYDAIRRIPPGMVATYAQVAAAVGCGSPRAVGQALRRNPWAPQVPCHRVIAADGRIGGYSGAVGGPKLARKQALLDGEGVHFVKGRLVDRARITPVL